MSQQPKRVAVVFLAAALSGIAPAFAEDAPKPAPPLVQVRLPDEKPYQAELRKYLGTLTVKDFEHGITADPKVTPITDPQELFRTWLLTLEFPRIGRKRSAPSLNLPPVEFTLAHIENEKAVLRPALWPEPTAWVATWNYPGNPYFNSRAVKLRAFATMATMMLLTDDLQMHSPAKAHHRSDWFGQHLTMYGFVYPRVKDVVPPEAQIAFETCLKGMMQRVTQWGPTDDETYLDIGTVLGMRLAADALKDPASMKVAEDYAHRIFSDERFYNNTGYFPDQGCFDAGYNGLAMYFGTWLALDAPEWTFVGDAVKKAWKMRAYLLLPEPDGAFVGPAHFNARTNSDVLHDQWEWPFKYMAGAMLTDDAMCQAKFPDAEALQKGPETAIGEFGAQLHENPGYLPSDKLTSSPWLFMLFPDSFQFPMNNFAFDYCPKGFYAHRLELEKQNSPLLKVPFARPGDFTQAFGKTFLFAKRAGFGVVLHTGSVAEFKGDGHVEFTGPYGLSGGALSSFWTPATGSVILGSRGGMAFPNNKPPNYDLPEEWRLWPVHAVSGVTADGKNFTSARIQKPDATYDIGDKKTVVKVSGVIPSVTMGTTRSIEGKLDFSRSFEVDEKGLSVTTAVSGDGKDKITELYEVIPVFLRENARQAKAVPTTIEFESEGKFVPATDQYAITGAVRLARFDGAVVIRFAKPQHVKLSSADWNGKYIDHPSCRNILIDLLDNNEQPTALKEARSVSYRIEPVAKP